MKILYDSYNTIFQRGGGGIPMRVSTIVNGMKKRDVFVKLFDKWNDKICDYDILHVFKANIDSYSEIMFAKNSGVKVVLSSVVPQEAQIKIILGLFLQRVFKINNTYSYLKLVLENSDVIIAQTEKESLFINKYFKIDQSKIAVIPNGINQAVVDSYSADIEKNIVLCVGRFDKNKNQLGLIKAMRNTGIPVHFVGGSVPEEEDYYKVCLQEVEGDPSFVFHGWLKQGSPELISLFSRAKVCVLISYKEIFGNAIVEGAACGSNLVVTKSLPISEYGFDSNCFVVDPSDVNSIKHAVCQAYEEPLTIKLRKIALERFSWDTIIDRHIKLYESLIENKTMVH